MVEPKQLLDIWEGNRRLTIRTIEQFPEHELFHYTPAEPLRPFAQMVFEVLTLEKDYMRGIALGEWELTDSFSGIDNRERLLEACDEVRKRTRELWEKVTADRLQEVEPDRFFGGPPDSHFNRIQYALENEIHHRGQAYTYLRLLGIEPPPFYIR